MIMLAMAIETVTWVEFAITMVISTVMSAKTAEAMNMVTVIDDHERR